MKLSEFSIETLKTLIAIFLWAGFFVAGFLISNWYTQNMYYEKFENMLGDALDEKNQCIRGDLLNASKILSEFPQLANRTHDNSS